MARLEEYIHAIGRCSVYTDDCMRFYMIFNCFCDMVILHKELGKAVDDFNDTVLAVAQRGLLKDVDVYYKLIGTTIRGAMIS
jgi:hypothetical protein